MTEEDNEEKESKVESVNIVGEIHKIEGKNWTEEFKLIDRDKDEHIVISNSDVSEKFMEDGLVYRIIGDKEDEKITLNDYEVLADDWEAYEEKKAKEEEKQQINNTIEDRVAGKYEDTDIQKVEINDNLGTDEEGDYIVLVHLKWNRKNKPKTTKDMLEMYSDDLAATLAEEENITEITVFWEVPYHLEGDNIAKMNYTRSGEKMAIGERWYDPIIR